MWKTAPEFATSWPAVFVVSFRIRRAPQLTVTESVLEPPPSLPEAAVAVLLTIAQSAALVCDVMWIGPRLAPAARVAKVQLRIWLPTAPEIPQPVKSGLSDQLRSLPAPA